MHKDRDYLEGLASYIENSLASQRVHIQIIGGTVSPWNTTFYLEPLNHTRFIDVKTALPSILEEFTFDFERDSNGWILIIPRIERLTTREFELDLDSLLSNGVSIELALVVASPYYPKDARMYASMLEFTHSSIDLELLEFLGVGSEIRRCYTQYMLDYGNGNTSDTYTLHCASLYEKYQQVFNLKPLPLELPVYT